MCKNPDLVIDKDSRLDENFLFQFFNLIDEETEFLKKEKEKMYQEATQNESTDLNFITVSAILLGHFTLRKIAISEMIRQFIYYAKKIKLNLNDIKKYFEIQCMKIIMETQTSFFDFETWLSSVTLILCLSNNNDIDEELLTRVIEALLNAKVANNETNELKSQLEQQLKEKLYELKGKQKKLRELKK